MMLIVAVISVILCDIECHSILMLLCIYICLTKKILKRDVILSVCSAIISSYQSCSIKIIL
jgi:hypothetical protein